MKVYEVKKLPEARLYSKRIHCHTDPPVPFRNQAYDRSVGHALVDSLDDAGLVTTVFHQPKSRSDCDFANDVESVVLHELSHIESLAILSILLYSLQQDLITSVDERLIG